MANKKINSNGFEYVDLGLPSGTKWATCNVGANKPSESGLYFQWGVTDGYTKEQVGKEKYFNCNDYKWYSDGTFTKYTIEGEISLDLEDDAANANMGGDWHIPSSKQIKELLNNTTNTWTTQDGVNGILFTSKKDASKSIFIPAAGGAWNSLVTDIGDCGVVWTSMLGEDFVNIGKYLLFTSAGSFLKFGCRYNGLSVRGVIG